MRETEIRVGDIVRHFKREWVEDGSTKYLYKVLAFARHTETGERMVVYQALYGQRGIWVRPAAMWNETVTREGKTLPRFTYIGE